MANLLFKKGTYADFKSKILDQSNAAEGTLYFTEDEGSLYLGKAGGKAIRIQGTIHQYDTLTDFVGDVKPPYSTDVVYFIAEKNALIRWDSTANNNQGAFVQLNTPAAFSEALSGKLGEIEALFAGVDLKALMDAVGTPGDEETNSPTGLYAEIANLDTQINDLDEQINDKEDGIVTQIASFNQKFVDLDGTLSEDNIVYKKNFSTLFNAESDKLGISDLTSRIEDLESNVGKPEEGKDPPVNGLYEKTQELEESIGEISIAIEEINSTKASAGALGALATKVGDYSPTFDGKEISLCGNIEELDGQINNLDEQINDKEDGIVTQIASFNQKFGELDKTLADKVGSGAFNTLSDNLNAQINSKIIATNAMTYKNGIDDIDDLPSSASIGDTYIFTHIDGALLNGQPVYPGDLLIAQGSENENGIIQENIEWIIVSTGYNLLYNPSLIVREDTNNKKVISLRDHLETEISQIQLLSDSVTIKIEDADNGNVENNALRLELEWGSF